MQISKVKRRKARRSGHWMGSLALLLLTMSLLLVISKRLLAENLYLNAQTRPHKSSSMYLNGIDRTDRMNHIDHLDHFDQLPKKQGKVTEFKRGLQDKPMTGPLSLGASLYLGAGENPGDDELENGPFQGLITSQMHFAVDKDLRKADIDTPAHTPLVEHSESVPELIVSGAATSRLRSGNQNALFNPSVLDLVNQMNADLKEASNSLTRISSALLNTSDDRAE